MNIQLYIILIIITLLIILLYRELYMFKDYYFKSYKDLTLNIKHNNDAITNHLQHNITKCVSQIRSISNENLRCRKAKNTIGSIVQNRYVA